MKHSFQERASLSRKGNYFEAFTPGRVFEHHWGKTIRAAEAALFSNLILDFNPMYFNKEYAGAHGYNETPVNPLLVFSTVFGLSVEDLSELGGAFLGVDDLEYGTPVFPDDTLRARSTVMRLRDSASNPSVGVVTWRTEGLNHRDESVVVFNRTNLVLRQSPL